MLQLVDKPFGHPVVVSQRTCCKKGRPFFLEADGKGFQLADAPRSTKDIDIFWLDEDGLQQAYALLRESTQVIKQKHDLDADWLNYLAQMLLFDEVIVPDGQLFPRFGPLYVYVLALKITAGRQKDLDDCALLLPKTKIRTRKQA